MKGQRLNLEHNYRVATIVDSVQEAFTLVMATLDVLADDPHITIAPIWIYGDPDIDGPQGSRKFEVSISGTPRIPVEVTCTF